MVLRKILCFIGYYWCMVYTLCSSMSADGKKDHVHTIPDEDQTDEMGYHTHIHTHIPFTPPSDSQLSTSNAAPSLRSSDGKKEVVSRDEELGRSPGMTTCTSCQQQVMTDITFKVGKFAKLICLLITILGLFTCMASIFLLPVPFCVKDCKDVYHTCPLCNTVLHVDKKQFCKSRT